MASRFSDINRGPELQDQYNKLQDWRKLTKAQKQAAYNAVKKPATDRVLPEYSIAWIEPFSATKDGIYYETKVPSATQTGQGTDLATLLRSLCTGRFVEAAPAGATDVIIDPAKFAFAKVKASKRSSATATDATSRLTGNPYKRWRYDNMSMSFGKSATQTDYYAAVKAMKAIAGYSTFRATKGNSIGFRPEGI